ncbi:hypothetical protein PMAYCL1PPCAC_16922, partial [Pristionchus mayeri]
KVIQWHFLCYCGKHKYSYCPTITSISDRKSILREKKLCFKCLSPHHTFTQCDRKCKQCTKPHHNTLCDSPSTRPTQSGVNAAVTSDQPANGVARLYTASVSLQNPMTNRTATRHVFLDTGGMVSVISRSLVEELSLKPHGTQSMTISGIGGEFTGGNVHDVVTVNVVTTKGLHSIQALVMDSVITRSMHLQPLSAEDYTVVKAHCGDVPHFTQSSIVTPDLLISITDTQDLLVDSKITNLPSGYRLTQSILGPMITGKSKLMVHSTPVESILTSPDHITRGLTSIDMNDPNHMWWQGAPWMKDPPGKWPDDPIPPTAHPPYAQIAEPIQSPLINLKIELESNFESSHNSNIDLTDRPTPHAMTTRSKSVTPR